ncbi:MAG: hypothetical protein ABWZ90_11375 [Acidimicrobiales bacterium]
MSLGPLVPADETFHHQITDTFATVGQSDRSWTEKVCAQAAARDGSVQVHLGMGKYPNRGVLDAYAGVSRGIEQWTVRASRPLAPDPDGTVVGPIRYEVLEPLRSVRFALDANDVVPVAFEWTFEGAVPPALENREVHRGPDSFRIDADIVRYHHTGVAHGWVEVDGERMPIEPRTWFSTRDHSWGVRYMVGAPVDDVPTRGEVPGLASLIIWSPMLCQTDDGEPYALHVFHQQHAVGDYRQVTTQGGVEHPDGRRESFVAIVPELAFDPVNRRLRGGVLHCTTAAGVERRLTITALDETGFHLGAGLYFGFDDQWHGQFRGRGLHLDGEHIGDCTTVEAAHRLHQLRDTVIRVDDPVGGGTGWGNAQTMATGPHPDLGLTEDTSFV